MSKLLKFMINILLKMIIDLINTRCGGINYTKIKWLGKRAGIHILHAGYTGIRCFKFHLICNKAGEK